MSHIMSSPGPHFLHNKLGPAARENRIRCLRNLAEKSECDPRRTGPYHTLGEIGVWEGVARIAEAYCYREREEQMIHGTLVNLTSNRVRTYLKGVCCVACGVKGEVWRIQRQTAYSLYHLNLYARHGRKGWVLMTSDHIVPKSRGGSDGLENRQPMCVTCNEKKGNAMNFNDVER